MSTELERYSEDEKSSETFEGDLSITSLYTAGVWEWAQIDGAMYLANDDTRRVFKVTNAALSIMRIFRWGLPKLPEGLAQRHLLIDQLTSEYQPHTILELAAGLSMRGWRMTHHLHEGDLPHQYIEIDLPHVVRYKRDRLQPLSLPPKLRVIGSDLKDLSLQQVEELIGQSERSLVIAEGLFMYLTSNEVERLLTVITPHLSRGRGRLLFDWVPTIEQPKPGLIGRGLSFLMKLFTGGDSFQRDERSRGHMSTLLEEYGARSVQVIDPRAVAIERSLPFSEHHTQQLIFCADF